MTERRLPKFETVADGNGAHTMTWTSPAEPHDNDARREEIANKFRTDREAERAKRLAEPEKEPEKVQSPADPDFWVVTICGQNEKGIVFAAEAEARDHAIKRARLEPGQKVIVMKIIAAYATPKPSVESVPIREVIEGI